MIDNEQKYLLQINNNNRKHETVRELGKDRIISLTSQQSQRSLIWESDVSNCEHILVICILIQFPRMLALT